jgi:hypothetical protein
VKSADAFRIKSLKNQTFHLLYKVYISLLFILSSDFIRDIPSVTILYSFQYQMSHLLFFMPFLLLADALVVFP